MSESLVTLVSRGTGALQTLNDPMIVPPIPVKCPGIFCTNIRILWNSK